MLQVKKEKNRKFKQLESKGWLDGWQEEEDRVLKLEAYSLEDLDRLESAEILPEYKKNPKVPKQERYISTKKEFELGDFKRV